MMRKRVQRLSKAARLLGSAVRLLWQSDHKAFVGALTVQVLTGASVAVGLLAARAVLRDIVSAPTSGYGLLTTVLPALIIAVVSTAVLSASGTGQAAVVRLLGESATKYTFLKIFEGANRVELREFEDPAFHNQLQRAKFSSLAPLQLTMDLLAVVRGGVIIIGVVVFLGTVKWWLLLVVLCGYVPFAVFTAQNSRELYSFNFGQAEGDRMMLYFDSLLTDRRTAAEIRGFALADYFTKRYMSLNDERIAKVRTLAARELRRAGWAGIASAITRGGALILLIAAVIANQIPLSSAATCAIAIQVLASRLENFGSSFGSLVQQSLLISDLLVFIDLGRGESFAVAAPAEPMAVAGGPRTVQARNVGFTYPGSSTQALKDVSVTIAPGQVVALVGENGSGKTTLAKIVAGLYLPTEGELLIDGVPLDAAGMARQRARSAMVFQDFSKFEISAADNIYAGSVQPDRSAADQADGIQAAARLAGADEFLAGLPSGYQTVLSRQFGNGVDLSGGQWQRVALARAYFRDAPLIVLDEPTAALDPRGEYELYESVRELTKGRSVLMISHRLSSVREADRIYVLDHGSIVEEGTHGSLMERDGLYRELFTIQASAYTDGVEAPESRMEWEKVTRQTR
jgi:ATP-binding cassette subfamily B protein